MLMMCYLEMYLEIKRGNFKGNQPSLKVLTLADNLQDNLKDLLQGMTDKIGSLLVGLDPRTKVTRGGPGNGRGIEETNKI